MPLECVIILFFYYNRDNENTGYLDSHNQLLSVGTIAQQFSLHPSNVSWFVLLMDFYNASIISLHNKNVHYNKLYQQYFHAVMLLVYGTHFVHFVSSFSAVILTIPR